MTNYEPVFIRKTRSVVHLVTYKGGRRFARFFNLARKRVRNYSKLAHRNVRILVKKIKSTRIAIFNIVRYVFRRLLRFHKPFVRFHKRRVRFRERVSALRFEQKIERDVLTRGLSGRPIILGPWISEVGFEVLYWLPFLHWLKAKCNWDPMHVLAISRGGVASWYREIASNYIEIFEQIEPNVFADRSIERRAANDGSHKQLTFSDFDSQLISLARKRSGFDDAVVVHPSDMYQLFRQYWLGHRDVSYVQERTRFPEKNLIGNFDLSILPKDYVAVKAYTATSLPDSQANLKILNEIVSLLSERSNVVMLDTGLMIDDHKDYQLDKRSNVFNLSRVMTPANNLGLQAEVISNARAFVGTCGSLTWIAPMLEVDTVALFSDASFLRTHLLFARQAYLEMDAGSFATVDVTAFDTLGFSLGDVMSRIYRPRVS